jgi:hypothetical protein
MTKKFNWVYGWVWKSVVLIDQWSCINNQLWCYTIVKNTHTHTHTHTHTMCRGIKRYGGLNSHVRDNLDSQFVYRRKSIVLFFFFFFYSLAMLMSLGWIAYSVAILVLHGAGPNILQRCWVWLRNHTAYGQYGCVVT